MKNLQKVIVVLILFGCLFIYAGCSTTHIIRSVEDNPLPKIAETARDRYSTSWKDENHFTVRKIIHKWSWWSIGVATFHGDMHYRDKEFSGEFYIRNIALGTLFLPAKIDLGSSIVGGALKPSGRKLMNELLEGGNLMKREP